MKGAVLAAIVLASACGGGVTSPSPTPTGTRTSIATVAVSQSAVPSATPITSGKGFITVARPLASTRITSPVVVSGDASVFEAALQWRIVDGGGKVYAQGVTTASAGAPARGTFLVNVTYTGPTADVGGFVEVYETSPRDGSIDDIVRVPVTIGR